MSFLSSPRSKKQTLDDAYAAPANFLEIDVINPITHGVAGKRYTDYEVRLKVGPLPSHPLSAPGLYSNLCSDQPASLQSEGVQCSPEIF